VTSLPVGAQRGRCRKCAGGRLQELREEDGWSGAGVYVFLSVPAAAAAVKRTRVCGKARTKRRRRSKRGVAD
jgi:hypothetical protein